VSAEVFAKAKLDSAASIFSTYALSGDTIKARTKYQDFFALWKNADSDIPILKQAKAESRSWNERIAFLSITMAAWP
jgi:hypothetical protein